MAVDNKLIERFLDTLIDPYVRRSNQPAERSSKGKDAVTTG
jgi:hypothetical protein